MDGSTIRGYIKALQIMAKHAEEGLDTKSFLDAQHDCISTYLATDQLPETSEDGQRLLALGWFEDEGYWARFT